MLCTLWGLALASTLLLLVYNDKEANNTTPNMDGHSTVEVIFACVSFFIATGIIGLLIRKSLLAGIVNTQEGYRLFAENKNTCLETENQLFRTISYDTVRRISSNTPEEGRLSQIQKRAALQVRPLKYKARSILDPQNGNSLFEIKIDLKTTQKCISDLVMNEGEFQALNQKQRELMKEGRMVLMIAINLKALFKKHSATRKLEIKGLDDIRKMEKTGIRSITTLTAPRRKSRIDAQQLLEQMKAKERRSLERLAKNPTIALNPARYPNLHLAFIKCAALYRTENTTISSLPNLEKALYRQNIPKNSEGEICEFWKDFIEKSEGNTAQVDYSDSKLLGPESFRKLNALYIKPGVIINMGTYVPRKKDTEKTCALRAMDSRITKQNLSVLSDIFLLHQKVLTEKGEKSKTCTTELRKHIVEHASAARMCINALESLGLTFSCVLDEDVDLWMNSGDPTADELRKLLKIQTQEGIEGFKSRIEEAMKTPISPQSALND